MKLTNARNGYGTVSLALHWVMLLLLVAVYATMELKSIYPRGSAGRAGIMGWHYMLGLAAFALVWVRLAFRHLGTKPVIEPAPPAWQNHLAALVHVLLYALMIALPLLGWLVLSAKGESIPFFGMELQPLIGENVSLGKQLKEVHETIATAGYFIIGLHALAALFHHYILRDNTLKLMMPRH